MHPAQLAAIMAATGQSPYGARRARTGGYHRSSGPSRREVERANNWPTQEEFDKRDLEDWHRGSPAGRPAERDHYYGKTLPTGVTPETMAGRHPSGATVVYPYDIRRHMFFSHHRPGYKRMKQGWDPFIKDYDLNASDNPDAAYILAGEDGYVKHLAGGQDRDGFGHFRDASKDKVAFMWTPGPSLPRHIDPLWLYHQSTIPRADVPNYKWAPGNDKVDNAFSDLRKWVIQERIDRLMRRNPWLGRERKSPRRSLPKKTEPEAPVTPPEGGWFGG